MPYFMSKDSSLFSNIHQINNLVNLQSSQTCRYLSFLGCSQLLTAKLVLALLLGLLALPVGLESCNSSHCFCSCGSFTQCFGHLVHQRCLCAFCQQQISADASIPLPLVAGLVNKTNPKAVLGNLLW